MIKACSDKQQVLSVQKEKLIIKIICDVRTIRKGNNEETVAEWPGGG
jgi:hypothetical protein